MKIMMTSKEKLNTREKYMLFYIFHLKKKVYHQGLHQSDKITNKIIENKQIKNNKNK